MWDEGGGLDVEERRKRKKKKEEKLETEHLV